MLDEKLVEDCLKYEKFSEFCYGRECIGCIFEGKHTDLCSTRFEKLKNVEKKEKFDYYIAAPFFNEEQIERVEIVERLLEKRGLTYFSPRKDSAVADINNPVERKRVFKLNCDSILNSKGLIAIADDKDTGTMFECGFAYAKNIPISYVALDLKGKKFNLMLAESGESVSQTEQEIIDTLDGKNIYYEGDIE